MQCTLNVIGSVVIKMDGQLQSQLPLDLLSVCVIRGTHSFGMTQTAFESRS